MYTYRIASVYVYYICLYFVCVCVFASVCVYVCDCVNAQSAGCIAVKLRYALRIISKCAIAFFIAHG